MFSAFPEETVYGYPVPGVFDETLIKQLVQEADPSANDGPLSVYIHIPFCSAICNFCGFTRTSKFKKQDIVQHTDLLIEEMRLVVEQFGVGDRAVHAVFFGGGTASLLPRKDLTRIVETIHRYFNVRGDAEWTFEGDCNSLKKDGFVELLPDLGFQRLSFGVQTVIEGYRKALNLKPSLTDITRLIDRANPLFRDVSVDMIYGWPGQSPSLLSADLNDLLDRTNIASIDLFQFEKLDANPSFLSLLYQNGIADLTTSELQELRRAGLEVLKGRGFSERSYSFFSRNASISGPASYADCYYGFGSGEVLGVGRGAQSFLNGVMWGNSFPADEYAFHVANGSVPMKSFACYRPTERELVNWPRRGTLLLDAVNQDDVPSYDAKLNQLIANGYASRIGSMIKLSEKGRDWVPSILEFLMPPAQHKAYVTETKRFSHLYSSGEGSNAVA